MTQRIVQSPCKDALLDGLSKELLHQAMECVVQKNEFHLALSESDSLDDFYALLMCDPELRGMPWGKTHVWFFGETTPEDSIQLAIEAHSGIPQEQSHNMNEGVTDGTTIDCCIASGDDLHGLPHDILQHCTSWLIVGSEVPPTVELGGVSHIFVIN